MTLAWRLRLAQRLVLPRAGGDDSPRRTSRSISWRRIHA
jgi:hypothetical protein